MIGAIIEGVVGVVTRYQDRKAKKAERQDRLDEAKVTAQIDRIRDADDAATDLDMYFVKNNGLKDDISFYVFLLPAVACFVPGGAEYVTEGFVALEGMPEWYQYTLAGMMIAIWGYRRVLQTFINSKVGKLLK